MSRVSTSARRCEAEDAVAPAWAGALKSCRGAMSIHCIMGKDAAPFFSLPRCISPSASHQDHPDSPPNPNETNDLVKKQSFEIC